MRGVRCMLVERKDAPQFLPKVERCNARPMEIYRRMGLAGRIRAAGLPRDCPMDVFIVDSLIEPPLVHHPYPSVAQAQAEIAACRDGSLPLEPCQLISQYTLEPLLKPVADSLPSVSVRYGCDTTGLERAFTAPLQILLMEDPKAREIYGRDLPLLRPDLHVAWRGNAAPAEPERLAAQVTGWTSQRVLRAGCAPP